MRYLRLVLSFLVSLGAMVGFTQQVVTSQVARIAVFKQGYGVVVREVTLPAGTVDAMITDVPVPVHGTFWVITPPEITLKTVTATQGEHPVQLPAISLPELLQANIGEQVELKTPDGWINGKLLAVAGARIKDEHLPPIIPRDYRFDRYASNWAYRPTPEVSGGTEVANLLLMETAEGQTAFPLSNVMQMRKKPGNGALKTTFTRPETGAELHIHTAGPGGKVQVVYLTRGITWAPSYRLELGKVTAHLIGKAVIVNDAEDFTDSELTCMAGFPNMKFAAVVDPLGLKGSVADFLAALQSPTGAADRPSVMTQAVMYNSAPPPDALAQPAPDMPAEPGDLHHYLFPAITLGFGARAYLPLFDIETPYTEIYRWDVADRFQDYNRNNYNTEVPVSRGEDVWHAVRLKHTGKLPWTTAPVMVVNDGNFLGQDTLYYTPIGGSTLINITKAVDVAATMKETTVAKGEVERIGGNPYRLLTMQGELAITNFKTVPVHLLVTKQMTGDLQDSAPKVATNEESARVNAVNARRTLTWEITIPAQQHAIITYKYSMYLYAG